MKLHPANAVAEQCLQALDEHIPKPQVVVYSRQLLVALGGDDDATRLISRIIYLMSRSKDPGGRVHHYRWQFGHFFGWNRKRLDAALDCLKSKGLLEWETNNRNHRTWFRVIPTALSNLLAAREGDFKDLTTDIPKPKALMKPKKEQCCAAGTPDSDSVFPKEKQLPTLLPGKSAAKADSIFSETEQPTTDTTDSELQSREAAPEQISDRPVPAVDHFGLQCGTSPLPADHPDRAAVTYERGKRMVVSAQQCLEHISQVPVAEQIRLLFPGQQWDESTARMFFRKYLEGRLTEGFMRYVYTVGKSRSPGAMATLRTFFEQFKFNAMEAAYRDTVRYEVDKLESEMLKAAVVQHDGTPYDAEYRKVEDLYCELDLMDGDAKDKAHKGRFDRVRVMNGNLPLVEKFPETFKILVLGYCNAFDMDGDPLLNCSTEKKFKRIQALVRKLAVEDASFRALIEPDQWQRYELDPTEVDQAAWDYIQTRAKKLHLRGWTPERLAVRIQAEQENEAMAA